MKLANILDSKSSAARLAGSSPAPGTILDTAKPKVLVIIGPTASGKSALAIKLAKKYNGEVVSADSRQVYKGLDIGSGKVTTKEMAGVPHHMLDIASPRRVYTVDHYVKDARKVLAKILAKNKLPIICGGTGFYIDALVYGIQFPDVPLNTALRNKLKKLKTEKLYSLLYKKDRSRARAVDRHNRVRLIRALEIVEALGKVPKMTAFEQPYDARMLGIKIDQKRLQKNIKTRLLSRMKQGMIAEVRNLHAQGLSWKRLDMLGLEYRYVSRYLRGLISQEEMTAKLEEKIWQYAKRQMTWFKRNKDIEWI